jgi:rhamnosyltransferase
VLKYDSMYISVIIPTLNAGPYIEKLLSKIREQDVGSSEVIIIDSSSEDRTEDIAREFHAKTIVIPSHTFNHGKTRNMAAMEATGDILIFMTQDAFPLDHTLFRTLTAPLQTADIAATFGRQIPKTDASPLEIFVRQFNYPDKGTVKGLGDVKQYGIKTFFLSNVCSAFKKEAFMRVGMFPENISANEDMLITAKLLMNGYQVAYVPEAKVIHSHNLSLSEQFRRYFNIGSSLKRNSWIRKYAQPEGEGMKLVLQQLSFVVKRHEYRWIPYIFLESMTKYLGYRIGLFAG